MAAWLPQAQVVAGGRAVPAVARDAVRHQTVAVQAVEREQGGPARSAPVPCGVPAGQKGAWGAGP